RPAERTGVGPGTTCASIGPNGALKGQVSGQGGVPASGAGAVAVSVAVVNGTNAYGAVVLWPSDAPQPNTANVSYPPTQAISNGAIVKLAADGTITIKNIPLYGTSPTVDVVIDVQGW